MEQRRRRYVCSRQSTDEFMSESFMRVYTRRSILTYDF